MLRRFDGPQKAKQPSWIRYVVIFFVSSQVIRYIYYLYAGKLYDHIPNYFFGYSFQQELYNDVVAYLLDAFQVMFISMPIMTFVFFYIVVCGDVKYIIKDFQKSFVFKDTCNYETLFHYYYAIKSAADMIDNTVGFLVFTTIIYNSCATCFSLHVTLRSDMDYVDSVAFYYWFASNYALFIIMTASAASVADASEEVASAVLILPEVKGNSNWSQQKFFALVDKKITFTVWKITPIRRNFIFGVSGLIFTYSLMFHSLSPDKRD
ncbi:uncharacterized protein NPIL_130891 [Nephila pilipes]|uniref:Uncharacterized protein n=1 Tax=Nephila pilipes TaxID=299642 RepID=A0A8X6MNP7_NEPPI|nr:uncharacterized protein NPIL_130891 [Nephila pilipes]